MEELPEKIERIITDVDKILDLYDYAENLYSYENLRGPQ
jgi:hypothetical protein